MDGTAMLTRAEALASLHHASSYESSASADAPALPGDEVRRRIRLAMRDPNHRARMVAVATRALGGAADAEDCVQEALMLAERFAPRFEGRSNITSWMHTILVNVCRMHRRALRSERRGGRTTTVDLDDAATELGSMTSPDDPEESAAWREALDAVERELEHLPHHDRDTLAEQVGAFNREAMPATELRAMDGGTKVRMFRLRKRLLRALPQHDTLAHGVDHAAV